jgi:hypothetical protein
LCRFAFINAAGIKPIPRALYGEWKEVYSLKVDARDLAGTMTKPNKPCKDAGAEITRR